MAKKTSAIAVSKLERELENYRHQTTESLAQIKSSTTETQQAESDTRNEIARNFMRWYFWILVLLLIGIPVYNLVAHQVTGGDKYTLTPIDMIQTYTSVVGPLFGFVIAYYFKSKNDN